MSDGEDEALERERRLRFETAERLKRIKEKAKQVEIQKELERQENLKQKRIQHQTYVQQPPKPQRPQSNQQQQPQSIQDQMKNDFERYLKNIQQYASMDLSYLKPLNQGENQDKKVFMKAVHDQYKNRPPSSKGSDLNGRSMQGAKVLSQAGSKKGENKNETQQSSQPRSISQSNVKQTDFDDHMLSDSDDLHEGDLYASQVKLLPETAVSTSDEDDLNKSLQRTKQEIQSQQMKNQPSKRYEQDFSQVIDKDGVRVVSKNSQRGQLDNSKNPKPLKPINSQSKAQQQTTQIKNKLTLLKQQGKQQSSNQLQTKQIGSRSVNSTANKKQQKIKPETLQAYNKLKQQIQQMENEENELAQNIVRLDNKIEYITTQSQYVNSLIQNLSVIKVDDGLKPPVSNGTDSQMSMASVFQSKAVSGMSPTQTHINKANTLVDDNEDLQALIERLNDLPDIQDSNEYTDEEKALVRDERIRLTTLIKQFQSRLIMNKVRNTTKVNKMQVVDPISKMKLPPSMQKDGKQNNQQEKPKKQLARQIFQPFKTSNKEDNKKQANNDTQNDINNEIFALSSAEPLNNTVKHVPSSNNDVENRSLLNALFGDNNQKPVENVKTLYQRNTKKSKPQSASNNPPVQVKQQHAEIEDGDENNDEPLYVNKTSYLDANQQEANEEGIYQIENNIKDYEQQKYQQFLKQYESTDGNDDNDDYEDNYNEQYGLYDMMQQGQVGQESDEDYDFTGV